jgi:hypothetical protein
MSIEYAAAVEDRAGVAAVILRAPPAIRETINRARVARGLTPISPARADAIATAGEPRQGPSVWIANPDGSLSPARSSRPAARKPATNATSSKGPLVTRVLMTVAYGDATAADVRGRLPETIAFNAFGSSAVLNADNGWSLQGGHNGAVLATAGSSLRAHDTPSGLIVEWLPNMALPWNRDAVQAIEEGRNAISVGMKILETRLARLPRLLKMVTRAKLTHVALLQDGQRPCYAGARAKVFRSSWRNDPDELRKQIDETITRARWYVRHAGNR